MKSSLILAPEGVYRRTEEVWKGISRTLWKHFEHVFAANVIFGEESSWGD
jgi:hypothetical protein